MSISGPKSYEIRGALGADRQMSAQVALTGTQASETAGNYWIEKPNAGYSGTPMWKLAQRAQQDTASAPSVKIPEGFKPTEKGSEWYYSEKRQVFWRSTDGSMYVWDALVQQRVLLHEAQNFDLRVSAGSCFHEGASQIRHLLVRDLMKAGTALRMNLEHLDKPCALYALHEGHRANTSAASSNNICAEYCAKHLHLKLLPKLSAFRGYWEDKHLEIAMRETFEELDADFAEKHGSSADGCCTAVALVTGDRVVVASLGDVACVVSQRGGDAEELLRPHCVADSDEEDSEDDTVAAAASAARPPVRWTHSFGDLEFKKATSAYRLLATPDVKVLKLQPNHQGVAFVCRALYKAIGKTVAVSTVFKRSLGRPRMSAGALVDAAVQWLGQVGDLGLGAIVVHFDRPDGGEAPPQKRARTEALSQVRLRHILLKHRECKTTVDKVRQKQVRRTRGEAERILRAFLEECASDPERKKFSARCRDLSECQSCLKSGELAGDLGWVKPGKYGQAFDDTAFALQIGQLSDLVDSDQGVHVVLRTA